jgi:hypothetical protein
MSGGRWAVAVSAEVAAGVAVAVAHMDVSYEVNNRFDKERTMLALFWFRPAFKDIYSDRMNR